METHVFNAVSIDRRRCIPALKKWFAQGTEAARDLPPPIPERPGVVLGFPLWGETYIDSFTRYCLPSLLAPANRAALKGSALVVFTARKDIGTLRTALKTAVEAGISAEIHIIPDYVMRTLPVHHNNKYWLLGAVEYLCLQIAVGKGLGYHMLMPDFVYSGAYFANLMRLARDHDAIAQTCISAERVPFRAAIEDWRSGGVIDIPARPLGGLAFENMHTITRNLIMNLADPSRALPKCHTLAWVGRTALYLYSCHLNISYMSPALVREAPPRLFNPLDTELPALMPGGCYVPGEDDGMVMVEVSGERDAVTDAPLTDWVLSCGMATNFNPAYDRFFAEPSVIPIGEQWESCPDDTRIRSHRALADLLTESRDTVKGLVLAEQKKHQKLFRRAA